MIPQKQVENKEFSLQMKVTAMHKEAQKLYDWYMEHQRSLPWRKDQDPYRIWISEMMLQQTTVTAVVPYYERFISRFPTLTALSQATLEEVFTLWAGLGYYSRARNIHKAAQILAKEGFPKSYEKLLELPGFGPYTARAVSSLAFGEKVGVVDGNVIRVLSRYLGWSRPWWNTKDRKAYQERADQLVQKHSSSVINQALMELGATVCTPQSPSCRLCPWQHNCQARRNENIHELPLKKPKKKSEVWVWDAHIPQRGNKVGLIENDYLPFLKGQWVFPGVIKKEKKKPKSYDVKHGITHHEIYVRVNSSQVKATKKVKWIETEKLNQINPSSLLQKILALREL